MMENIIEAVSKAETRIIMIGTTPITDPLAWKEMSHALFKKLDEGDIQIGIIAESDNQLFLHSLRTDTPYNDDSKRVTFTQLKLRRELLNQEIIKTEKRRSQSTIRISTLPLPIYVLQIDDSTWYLPATAREENLNRFKKVSDADDWRYIIEKYVKSILDEEKDGRYLAKKESELLELFDQDHIPRGIFPRDCFYDTDHYQYVVWAFVFSRDGKLLIHKRAINAKDNINMWDKSVGGHIDFSTERSSSDAIVRELIQELYTSEKSNQSGRDFSLLSEDLSKVYYMGQWRPGALGPDYLSHVKLLESQTKQGEEPWVYFKIGSTIERNTPRILPDSRGERRLRVLVDVYIFISNTVLTRDYAKKQLLNSQYDLVDPGKLKSWIENQTDSHGDPFKATPDLEFIMSGKFRDIIGEVSHLIEYSDLRRPMEDLS